jgi:hypothetical protein
MRLRPRCAPPHEGGVGSTCSASGRFKPKEHLSHGRALQQKRFATRETSALGERVPACNSHQNLLSFCPPTRAPRASPLPPPPCPPPPQHIIDVREYSSPAYSTTRALWLLTSSVQVTRQLLRVTDDAVTRRADRKRRRWTNLSFSRDVSSSERP